MAGYSLYLYLLKVTFKEFFLFTNTHTSTQIFGTKAFSAQVQISFIKLKVHSTSAVDGGMGAASLSTLMILGCHNAYSDVIHCSSIIPNENFFFPNSNSFTFSNNLFNFWIFWSWFICTKKIFFWRLSFKTQFKIEYFCCTTDLKKCLQLTLIWE